MRVGRLLLLVAGMIPWYECREGKFFVSENFNAFRCHAPQPFFEDCLLIMVEALKFGKWRHPVAFITIWIGYSVEKAAYHYFHVFYSFITRYQHLELGFRRCLPEVFFESTIEEWLDSHFFPRKDELQDLVSDAEHLIAIGASVLRPQ